MNYQVSFHSKALCTAALAIAFSPAEPTMAQFKQNVLSSIDLKGKLETFASNQFTLKADDKKDYTVVFDPSRVNFQYKGTADSGILSPGLMIRLVADFDQHGKPSAPIEELEVFSPRAPQWLTKQEIVEQTPGIYPLVQESTDAGNKSQAAGENKSRPEPNSKRSNNPNSEKSSRQPGQSASSKPKASIGPNEPSGNATEFRIVGRILNVQAGMVYVNARVRNIVIPFDPNATVKIVSGDPVFCAQGDQVEVEGLYQAKLPELVQAESIVVVGNQPIESMNAKFRKALTKSMKSQEQKNGRGQSLVSPTQNEKPNE